jgi:glycosyltransferase involved in cell wall biosynthesis
MKVLFVSSGKSGSVGEVVKNQGESLVKAGIEVDYFVIIPGLLGYIFAIPKIRKAFKRRNYNLIHAHYSLSAFAASIAGSFPLVVSLMGSDTYMSGFLRIAARFFYKNRWMVTIVKTIKMKEKLMMDNALVIPNGIDIERFKPIPKIDGRNHVGFPSDKKLILFISIPNRPEKNLELAEDALKAINNSDVVLKHIHNVPNEDMPFFYNAADALLLTSKWEGSVNVVKEAMACNCPIVTTDVGDVRWVLGETKGCYISSFEPEDVAEKVKRALAFGKRTDGRQRIINLGLDSETVASKIIAIYKDIVFHRKNTEP